MLHGISSLTSKSNVKENDQLWLIDLEDTTNHFHLARKYLNMIFISMECSGFEQKSVCICKHPFKMIFLWISKYILLYIFIYIKWFYIKEIKTGTGTRSLLQICIWPRDARENFYKTFYSNYILPFDGWHAENIYIPNWYSICTMYCTLYMID